MQNRFGEAIQKAKQSTQKYNQILTGVLGIPIGGQLVVEVPNRNSYVYVQLRNNPNEVIQAFNDQVAPSYQLPVLVQYIGNRYVVIGRDTMRYADWQSFSPYLPRHGESHSFDPEGGGGGDLVFVYPRQITPALVMPSGTLGASNVIINPYTIRNPADGTWKYVGNTGTQNLTVWNPTGSNAVMVLVCLDTTSGNPHYTVGSGSYFTNSITGTSLIPQYIPALTEDMVTAHIPLSAIRLISGTTTIGWDNIYDVRQWIKPVSSGTFNFQTSLFMSISGSDVGGGYYRLATSPFASNPESYITSNITSTSGTLLASFVTDSGVPNLSYLNEGIYWLHTNAYRSAGTADVRLFWQLYKRSGVTETLLVTSTQSDLLTNNEAERDMEVFVPLQSINTTDRLVVKIWGLEIGGGSAPTVRLGVEDLTFSRLSLPNIVGSSGGGIVSIPIQDEGILQGNVTSFNFRGPNVTATVSGTWADIYVTGSAGGGSNIAVLNSGTQITAAATAFDFQYPLYAGITGSKVYPSINGQLINWEDVSAQITGSNTHFNLTGTIALGTDRLYYNGLRQQRITHYTVDANGRGFSTLFTGTFGDVLVMEYGNIGATPQTPAGLNVYDSSVLQGAVQGISFDGNYLSAVVSGTNAYLNAVNLPSGTFQVQASGTTQGNVNVLNVGASLIPTISGQTITVSGTRPANYCYLWPENLVNVGAGSNWVYTADASQIYGFYYVNAGNNGDTFTLGCYLQGGIYTLSVLGVTQPTGGLTDFYIDGKLVASGIDWYSASLTRGAKKTATIVIPNDGCHQFKCVMNGKNASSSSYQFAWTKIWISPSAF